MLSRRLKRRNFLERTESLPSQGNSDSIPCVLCDLLHDDNGRYCLFMETIYGNPVIETKVDNGHEKERSEMSAPLQQS